MASEQMLNFFPETSQKKSNISKIAYKSIEFFENFLFLNRKFYIQVKNS